MKLREQEVDAQKSVRGPVLAQMLIRVITHDVPELQTRLIQLTTETNRHCSLLQRFHHANGLNGATALFAEALRDNGACLTAKKGRVAKIKSVSKVGRSTGQAHTHTHS